MKATSIESHESVKPHKARMYDKILKGFLKIGKGSFRDIARVQGLKESQVWKRFSEMKKLGMIKEDSVKKCPESNRPVTVWTLNESQQLNLL